MHWEIHPARMEISDEYSADFAFRDFYFIDDNEFLIRREISVGMNCR